MACQRCQLEVFQDLCQLCSHLQTMQPPPTQPVCRHCRFPIADPARSGSLCRLCKDLLQVVRSNPWLAGAQAEWEHENFLLAKRKQELLGRKRFREG